jgi:dihydrofolate reductase
VRHIVYFVASSLDGFIARKDGGVDWLFTDQDYGYTGFLAGIDTVVMGRKTYDLCLTFDDYPYRTQRNFVFSRTTRHFTHATAVAEPIPAFVERLRSEPGKDIWLIGGGELAGAFLAAGVVDELQVFVHPILIGTGLPLAAGLLRDVKLHLKDTQAFDTGLVKLAYEVVAWGNDG